MQEKLASFDYRKITKIIAQVVFIIVVFYFLGSALYANWNKVDINFSNINYYYLVLSLVLFSIALIGYAYCWNKAIVYLDNPLKLKRAIKIWFWSQSARYIPGSVWQIFGRIYIAGKDGISKGKVIASIGIETTMLIISSIIVFGISLPFNKELLTVNKYWPYLLVALSFFIFLYPKVFNRVTDLFVHRIDKDISFKMEIPFKEIMKLLLFYTIVWIIFGLAFFTLLSSLKPVSISLIPALIGVFAVSWVLGFLFVIAPGGLGARELVMVFLLSTIFTSSFAIVAAIISRIVMIIAELIILVISSSF